MIIFKQVEYIFNVSQNLVLAWGWKFTGLEITNTNISIILTCTYFLLQLLLSSLIRKATMDPANLKLAKKKGPVLQCTYTDCSEHGDRARVTMVRHVLLKHAANVQAPFQCSICDFVSMSEKELIKHTKWNLPHKSQGQRTFEIIKGREPMSISELNWIEEMGECSISYILVK